MLSRRKMLQIGAGALAGAAVAPGAAVQAAEGNAPFRLNYAPHLGQFDAHAGPDPVDQIAFMAEQGFRAFEDNTLRERSAAEQERIVDALQAHDMQMGVFVAHPIDWETPTLTTGDPESRRVFLDAVRQSISLAQRANATWMTVVPGVRDPQLDDGYQAAHVIDALREAAALLEPHDLVLVLEPLNTRKDHPGQFLTHTAQAYQICRAVNSPACKILFDVYHQQLTEGNLLRHLDAAWDEIAYVQVGDPPARTEPTTGEVNYRTLFAHLADVGYTGIIGMEHGMAGSGRAGEQAVIDAYRTVDPAA